MKSTKENVYPFLATETTLDLFLDWANANPALFDQQYPELSAGLTKQINTHPELNAALLEKLPELFPKWMENADKRVGTARLEELIRIANLLYSNFINKVYDHPIVEHSRKKMEPLAIEYFEFVKGLLDPPAPEQRTPIGFQQRDNF